ncbi:MAG: cyclic nucleotide-binding domain-containing protein [Granulosicoccaceae bacterium]|jgi:CRP-like cAMP-binding protein
MVVDIDDFSKRFPVIAKKLGREHIGTLLDTLTTRQVPAGEILIRENSESDTLYLVWDGSLKTTIKNNDESIELGHTRAGEWVGEVSMLDTGPATATITADTDSTVLALSAADFWNLDSRDPVITGRLLQAMTRLLAHRLRTSTDILFDSLDALEEPPAPESDTSLKKSLLNIYSNLMGTGQK